MYWVVNFIILSFLVTGCSIKSSKISTISKVNPTNGYETGCFVGEESISCKIKRVKRKIDILEMRIDDSLRGWGECCNGY
jgi:hypothetical protein